ncbi:MAG TPA: ABC transporter ATP-binding protein [Syntrophorhabdales bacterium]|nr:ABC transporter ATP-binding protein [Syntrophorhabdales bacterium]
MGFLNVQELSKSFGGLVVIQNLSFSVNEGEILGVIGPNGSGKTTLFNLITGFLSADEGTVEFCGANVANRRPSTICKSGITRTFQLVKPFLRMSALENVTAGRAYGREPARSMRQARKEAEEILGFTGINKKQHIVAQHLNLIDRKRLEIARALATRPKLLLLDEVFAGLNHAEVEEALALVSGIRGLGITMMIVEHVIRVILGVSNRVMVLSSGQKIFEGSPQGAVSDQKVIEAYLGEDFHA